MQDIFLLTCKILAYEKEIYTIKANTRSTSIDNISKKNMSEIYPSLRFFEIVGGSVLAGKAEIELVEYIYSLTFSFVSLDVCKTILNKDEVLLKKIAKELNVKNIYIFEVLSVKKIGKTTEKNDNI